MGLAYFRPDEDLEPEPNDDDEENEDEENEEGRRAEAWATHAPEWAWAALDAFDEAEGKAR